MVKKEARVLGLDDSPFNKWNDLDVMVIGTVFRGGSFLDGILSTRVKVDGTDSTDKLIELVNSCKFKPQLQAIFIDGIAFAGFNIIDIKKLHSKTRIPVIVVMRSLPNIKKIHSTLIKLGMKDKILLLNKAGAIKEVNHLFVQCVGINKKDVEELLTITCTHSNLPEALRVSHLIASGVILGESRGQA